MDGVFVFLLVLLLLAAAAGVLGAVLKLTLALVVSFVLTIVLLMWIGSWYARRRFRGFQRDLQTRADRQRRRGEAYDVGPDTHPPGLPDGR